MMEPYPWILFYSFVKFFYKLGTKQGINMWIIWQASYATMLEMFDSLGVDVETSDVSFSVSDDKGNGYEWCSQYGFSNYFAQKKKLLNPFNWRDLREIIKFGNDVERFAISLSGHWTSFGHRLCFSLLLDLCGSYLELLENNPDIDRNETLGQFLKSRGYSENFQNDYLVSCWRIYKYFYTNV